MSKQAIRKTIGILLAVLVVAAFSATAVSASLFDGSKFNVGFSNLDPSEQAVCTFVDNLWPGCNIFSFIDWTSDFTFFLEFIDKLIDI